MTGAVSGNAQADQQALIKEFPTMERLFGSMDFCECSHCRSVLSPAAYLVDLLQFIDFEGGAQPGASTRWAAEVGFWKSQHGEQGYPHKGDDGLPMTPYDALMQRRPDLKNVQLTCENTNTALPYIDLVNEILEEYVVSDNLESATPHDTGGAKTSDLLAEPQNILPAAYGILNEAVYPLRLPYDLWLDTIRRFSSRFDVPFHTILDAVRPTDELFAGTNEPYGRAAVFLEALGLCPALQDILAKDWTQDWFELYGYQDAITALTPPPDPPVAPAKPRDDLHSAKVMARRLGVTYKELADIVRTGFVNPQLPRLAVLQKLGIQVQDARAWQDAGGPNDPETQAIDEKITRLATRYVAGREHPDPVIAAEFQPRIDALVARIKNKLAAVPIGQVLVLADPGAECDFEQATLRYASAQPKAATPADFLRINLFVRLWRSLGWTMRETDLALQAFTPKDQPLGLDLSAGRLRTACIRMAHLEELRGALRVRRDARAQLLGFWTSIDAGGTDSVYQRLFLAHPRKAEGPFDDALGEYLQDPEAKLAHHRGPVQAALGLGADEVLHILSRADPAVLEYAQEGGVALAQVPANARLSIANISLLQRWAVLARGLRMPVADAMRLADLSGIDPFTVLASTPLATLAEDSAYTKTVAFVRLARELKDAELDIDSLDHLVCHRSSPGSAFDGDPADHEAATARLADAIRAIHAEHTLSADPSAVASDGLKQKIGLILAPEVAQTFVGMLDGSGAWTATKAVPGSSALDAALYTKAPEVVEVRYDGVKGDQWLILRGALGATRRAELAAGKLDPDPTAPAVPVAQLFKDLVVGIATQQDAFWDEHMAQQATMPTRGFMLAGDFAYLFDDEAFASSEPSASTGQDRTRLRGVRVVERFLPFLQDRLVDGVVTGALTAATGTNPDLAEGLVLDKRLMRATNAPIDDIRGLATMGVTAEFFGPAVDDPLGTRTLPDMDTDTGGLPGGRKHVLLSAMLRVSGHGAYRFRSTLPAGASAALRIRKGGRVVWQAEAAPGAHLGEGADDHVHMDAGVPYRIEFHATDVGTNAVRLTIEGDALSRGSLARLPLAPTAAFDAAAASIQRQEKALRLLLQLGIGLREVRHFALRDVGVPAIALAQIPVAGKDPDAASRLLMQQVLRLARYRALRASMVGGSERIVDTWEALETGSQEGFEDAVAKALRHDEAWVAEAVGAIAATSDIRDEHGLERLWRVLRICKRIGVPASELRTWCRVVEPGCSNDDRYAMARSARDALRARLDDDAWRNIAQPIFDKLRQGKRDALVAHVMDRIPEVERLEQLFEHFLVDPGMEPVVQTSRIRLAIASLQIFIQRCLLNLEAKVEPSILDAQQWAWKKRYRPWEANLKMWLWPENWCEPEFRDDKSHLFTELEGALLQGDVTEDLVEDAFLTYLRKLDGLACLEIVALHAEDDADPAKTTLHVFGRTFGIPHEHFYRRYRNGNWSAWEPVPAEIEGDHLAPVVWRDRLYLFWVTFMEKADPTGAPGDGATSATASLSSVTTALRNIGAKKLLDVQLHWIEKIQGTWSEPNVSEPMPVRKWIPSGGILILDTWIPIEQDVVWPVPAEFQTSDVTIHVSRDLQREDNADGDGAANKDEVSIHLSCDEFNLRLVKAGRNSPIRMLHGEKPPEMPFAQIERHATRYRDTAALEVKNEFLPDAPMAPSSAGPRPVLGKGGTFLLLPRNSSLHTDIREERGITEQASSLEAPFFYQDEERAFFVQPRVTEQTMPGYNIFVEVPTFDVEYRVPELWEEPIVLPWIPVGPDDLVNPPRPNELVVQPVLDLVTNPLVAVELDGRLIGRSGAVDADLVRTGQSAKGAYVRVSARTGAGDHVQVVGTTDGALEKAALSPAGSGLLVLDGSGLRAGTFQKISQGARFTKGGMA